MEENSYEQEIDLKDLMFAVLGRWRAVLAAALVFAVLFGGYRVLSAYRDRQDAETLQETQKEYETQVELYEKNVSGLTREIDMLMENISEQQSYLEQSLLMNMSPYDMWESKSVLFVKTDYQILPEMTYQDPDHTDTILQTYGTALKNREFLRSAAEKAGMEEQYLEELVTATVAGKLLTIQVRADSEETTSGIMDQMVDRVNGIKDRIRSDIGEHTVSVVDKSTGPLVDLTLSDTQQKQRDRLMSLNESLQTKQEELDGLASPELPATSMAGAVKGGIKYAVLGGVLGAFAVVFLVCVQFLMSDKLYSAKDLKNRYRLRILGRLPAEGKRKRFFLDAWLRKREGRVDEGVDGWSAGREYGLIAAGFGNCARDARNVPVIGTAEAEKVREVAENLSERLEGAAVMGSGNLLEEESILRMLPDCDCIVLVEQCAVSSCRDIARELEAVRDLHKTVAGCVVFE